jgi:hypothetical protein
VTDRLASSGKGPNTNDHPIRHGAVAVGAGQASLAIGYFLTLHGLEFTIQDDARYLAEQISKFDQPTSHETTAPSRVEADRRRHS